MSGSKEALVTYVYKHAGGDLRTLHALGGRGLHRLSLDLYLAFGQTPGDEDKIANTLSRLPMRIEDRLPSFVYTGRSEKLASLLVVNDKRYKHTIGFTLLSNMPGPVGISPARTPVVEAFIDGVKHIHEAMGVKEGRGGLYLHLLLITGLTAKHKGLTW